MDFAGTGGLRLAADVLGDSRHPPLVFIPGAGQTRRAWRRAAAIFAARGHYVVSLDLRGHGQSDWARDGDYSLDAFVGDVVAVVRTLHAPPILVGASIGGIASLVAIGENALPARGLVLVDVVPNMPGEGLDRIRAFMAAGAAGFANIEEASAAVASYLPHRARSDRTRSGSGVGIENNLRRGGDGRHYWHWDPAFHAGSKQRAATGMFERMAAAASATHIPTLLVSGAQSEVVNREGVEQLLRLMPQATWLQVPGASHMVAGDRNDVFSAALDDFTTRLSAASPLSSMT
jgi:pimeloyl-ACP methyl ester carboxylesterase